MVSLLCLVIDDSIHTNNLFCDHKKAIWAKLKLLRCFFKPVPKATVLYNLEM